MKCGSKHKEDKLQELQHELLPKTTNWVAAAAPDVTHRHRGRSAGRTLNAAGRT